MVVRGGNQNKKQITATSWVSLAAHNQHPEDVWNLFSFEKVVNYKYVPIKLSIAHASIEKPKEQIHTNMTLKLISQASSQMQLIKQTQFHFIFNDLLQ